MWPTTGHETDFDAPFDCGCNSVEHRKRVTFVVRVFQSRDHGLGRAYAASQLRLCEAGFLTQLMDFMSDFAIRHFFLERLLAFRFMSGDVRKDSRGVCCYLLRHLRFLH